MDPSRLTQTQKRLLARQKRATRAGRRPDLGNIYRVPVDLAFGETVEELLAAYRSRPDVEYAEPNPIIAISATPNDRSYVEQWGLAKIHAAEAWDICRGSSDLLVAVIDTGVDYNHPDLRANLWTNEAEQKGQAGIDDDKNGYTDDIRGYNFAADTSDPIDDHGHGTAMAGIIAAVGNNETDIAGVCWNVRIMPLKVLTATGNGTAADAVPAIYYAVANGADIISGSWGGSETSNTLRDAVAYAVEEGVVIVAAAGNSGSDAAYYPASYPEVIAVAATESNDNRWYLSNYGAWVDIAAPGRDIVSLRATLPGQPVRPGTVRMSGTSLAAPHVSGTCALLLAANPYLRSDELQQILRATGDPIAPGTCASNARLNVYQALRAVIPLAGSIRTDRVYYPEGTEIDLLLADWHLRGAGLATALVETSGGDLETITLQESAVALGILRAALARRNAAAVPGDGILEARDGEGIHVRYLDTDDGSGHVGQWRSAIAVADYQAPTVLRLEVNPQNVAATVEFHTNEPTRAEIRYFEGAATSPVTQRDLGWSDHHVIELRGLDVQTRYRFFVVLTDKADNTTLADNNGPGYTFITKQ